MFDKTLARLDDNISLINVILIYLLLKSFERIYLLHSSEAFFV